MALTGYAIGGIVMIVIGIILLIAGIVLLAVDQSNQTVSEWWVWALIVIGVIALLVGIALFFIPEPKTAMEKHMATRYAGDPCNPCPAPRCPPTHVELRPPCPKPCPRQCTLDVIHKDPCKQRAAEARHDARVAQIMPLAPVPSVSVARPSESRVEALERPRRLGTRPTRVSTSRGREETAPFPRTRVGALSRRPPRVSASRGRYAAPTTARRSVGFQEPL